MKFTLARLTAPAAVLFAKRAPVVSMFVIVGGFLAVPILIPNTGNAQGARIEKSMESLKEKTAKLGAPRIEGQDSVGGRDAPALYFGPAKMNNDFTIVDEVSDEDGRGMTATLFVRDKDDEFIRVSTNVPKPDGSGRAIGTVLADPALEALKAGKSYYGKVPILGTPYVTGYEPIKDESGETIGIYYVGYTQDDLLAKVEGRLAYAKTLLGITDEQAGFWRAYEDVSRANVTKMREAHQAMVNAEASGKSIDRMRAQTREMEAQLEARKALEPVTEELYKSLSPEQKQRADVVFLLLGKTGGGVEF